MDVRALENLVENGQGDNNKSLNVEDAIAYLARVQEAFHGKTEVYNRFLDIMKEYKGDLIDTAEVIERALALFSGNAHLVQGFNTFLPPGWSIDLPRPQSSISQIATPAAATVLTHGFFPPGHVAASQALGQGGKKVEFNHAISYVGKIKARYVMHPQTYQSFLNILQTYQK
ncbi:PAH2 domain-containing protein, partial [Atractiella rhizophila]